MPNYWESSGRPLFVKTVFINGNRHAILSKKDPLVQSGMFTLKKKRPGSSLSMASVFSASSTGSQESGLMKAANLRPKKRLIEDDISSQLQGCLIKLRLASSVQDNKKKSKRDLELNNSKEKMKWKQNGERPGSKQKRKKWNCNKSGKNCRHYYEEFTYDNEYEEPVNERNNCCYVYNFETNKGKKNYCFVKITSQPSQFILKCSCEDNWGNSQNICESKDCNNWNKNNLVISATFHNLIMTSDKNKKPTHNPSERWLPIESSDLCEVYLSKSNINPLSERVIQWLDLASKREKQEEKIQTSIQNLSSGIERIFGGKTFIDDNNEFKFIEKSGKENRIVIKKDGTSEKDVDTEVKGEEFIETALSIDKIQNGYKEWEEILLSRKNSRSESSPIQYIRNDLDWPKSEDETSLSVSIPSKIDPSLSMSSFLQNSIANKLSTSLTSDEEILNTTTSELNEILLDTNIQKSISDALGTQSKKKKSKDKNGYFIRQSKRRELHEEDDLYEENDLKITAVKYWKTKINKRHGFSNRFETLNESLLFQNGKNLGECVKQMKNRNLKSEFEKYKQSIDNPNITQTRPVNQNLSSPQQYNKLSCSSEGKSVWPAERDIGRPQLHIFIPTICIKEPSEESASECDSFLGVS